MNDKIIGLLKKDTFVSGEILAKNLGISRTAIWKQIKSLKDVGYEIESVKNKGYRLISKPDVPLPEEIKYGLETKVIGTDIVYFRKINSTNLYCKNIAKENASEGTVVVADIQEKGRGRKSRVWSSPEGGLWFSVLLKPDIPPQNAMILTMATSVSLVEAIEENTGLNPVIKWPNDLLIGSKKICGILTELDAEMDKINYAIVGVGINVNNSLSNDLQNIATTLKKESNIKISRVELLKDIIKNIDRNYNYVKSLDFDKIRQLWFLHADIIGKKVKVTREKDVVVGTVSDVDETGCLILDTKEGLEKIITGDVIFL